MLGAGYVWLAWTSSVKATSDRALSIASAMAEAMNGETLQQVQVVLEDIGTIPYESLKTRLISLRNIDTSVRFLYIYTQREGKIYFVADSEDPSSSDYSPPGQEFTEADSFVYVPFSGKSLITPPTTDRWGTWVSVLIPIKNSKTGQVAFVFGVDYPAENWNKKAIADSTHASIVVLFGLLLIGSFYVLFKNNLKLKESEWEYRLIFDQAPIGIYTINKDGIIDSFNPKMLDISGPKSTNDVLGLDVFSLDSYKKSGLDTFFREGLKGKYFTTEVEYFSQIGKKWSWRRYRGAPIFYPDSKAVKRLLLLVEDITKEKEVDKAKTEFVSLASHQLRTPLSMVNWYTEMLLAGDAGKLNKKQEKYLEEVYTGNQRMVDLVNSLLNVSRMELGTFSVNPEPTDTVRLAESVVIEQNPQITERKIKLTSDFAKNVPEINVDPKLLRMVFQNLLSNAVKYTPNGGAIKFSISLEKEKSQIHIQVADTGYGIPKNQQDKIFTKLFRADNVREKDTEGTGLGLYIVKSIIEHTEGTIRFESEENHGTTFYITLPIEGMKKKGFAKIFD